LQTIQEKSSSATLQSQSSRSSGLGSSVTPLDEVGTPASSHPYRAPSPNP
jgi:hypothetical protein